MIKRHLKVEVADTPEQHMQGLMFRKTLAEEDGMLFKFHSPQNLKFWGHNTYIPLAIAFVSPDHRIEKISYISPCSERVVASDKHCSMAIEANYDFFTKNKIMEGDYIKVVNKDDITYVEF